MYVVKCGRIEFVNTERVRETSIYGVLIDDCVFGRDQPALFQMAVKIVMPLENEHAINQAEHCVARRRETYPYAHACLPIPDDELA